MTQTYALQAITTKYLGPTNTKGARVKASYPYESLTVPWDYALSTFENHANAAKSLAVTLGWVSDSERYVIGATKDGYVLVINPA